MIVSDTIQIIVSTKDISRLKEYYGLLKVGDIQDIKIDYLSKNSSRKILVKCDICGKEKELSYGKYNKNIKKYNIYSCSNKCSIIKREKSNLFKCKYYSQTNEYKDRYKKTCLEKYGVENYFQSEIVKSEIKEVNLKKYGVEHSIQSKSIRDKIKITNESKSDDIKNEMKEKTKQSNLKKYGVEYSFQSDIVKNKIKETNLKKYGVEYSSQNKDNRSKYKITCLKKYGVDNVSKSDEIKKLKQDTCLEKYGVNHTSQVPEFYISQQKSGYRLFFHDNTKLNYRGTYEKHFLDYCFDNNILIERGKRIKYLFDNKEHYYFSDFYYESKNLIIEIKSDWTYNKYKIINDIKRESTEKLGYNYMFIFNKDYKEFEEAIKLNI